MIYIDMRTSAIKREIKSMICISGFSLTLLLFLSMTQVLSAQEIIFIQKDGDYSEAVEMNTKANGFRGIWYMNQPSHDEYVYKYSGGLATYTAKHRPFAIYAETVDKTFFCFGGTDDKNETLYHNVSWFDHKTGKVANPTIVLDKRTTDAHDNPVLSIDDAGHIWIFSTSHGTTRPSYIYKSRKPFCIDTFVKVNANERVDGASQPFDNFSYFQVYFMPESGFMALFTKYQKGSGNRVIGFNTSEDGVDWNEWQVIAHIEEGHYAISDQYGDKISIAFNFHPAGKGLNYRTNLYYLHTTDFGKTWLTASGESVQLPVTEKRNPAMVREYQRDGLNCYLKDLNHDENGDPVILVLSSKGYQSGPVNDPRTWEVFAYKGSWQHNHVTTSDNNYDMGSLYIERGGAWRIIAPTGTGPQDYNPGGEVEMWISDDRGNNWVRSGVLTTNSMRNHTYIRRPLYAHPDFYAFWADGHGRMPSKSKLYYCDKQGHIYELPQQMKAKKGRAVSVQSDH